MDEPAIREELQNVEKVLRTPSISAVPAATDKAIKSYIFLLSNQLPDREAATAQKNIQSIALTVTQVADAVRGR